MVDAEFVTPLGTLAILETYVQYDVPVVFLGESIAGHRYIVFWADTDSTPNGGNVWVLLPVSRERLSAIRTGEFSLLQAVQQAEDGWVWSLAMPLDGSPGRLARRAPAELPANYLPDTQFRLSLEDDRLPTLDEDLVTLARQRGREVVCVNLETPYRWHKVETSRLGLILMNTQSLTTALGAGPEASRGPYPKEVLDASMFYVSRLVAGSMSVVLESVQTVDLEGSTPTSRFVEALMDLLQSQGDELARRLRDAGGRATSRYRSLLQTLRDGHLGLTVKWGSPKPQQRSVQLDAQAVDGILEFLSQVLPRLVDRLVLHGVLTGFDSQRLRFSFKSDSGDRYHGEYHPQFPDPDVRIRLRDGLHCTATIDEAVEINAATGAEQVEHFLVDVVPDTATTSNE
ncbi:MAG: hypothetical protein Q8P50_17560 [Bacillota bacterium]|nr:hypothetical protein [Bacillota bacterium]